MLYHTSPDHQNGNRSQRFDILMYLLVVFALTFESYNMIYHWMFWWLSFLSLLEAIAGVRWLCGVCALFHIWIYISLSILNQLTIYVGCVFLFSVHQMLVGNFQFRFFFLEFFFFVSSKVKHSPPRNKMITLLIGKLLGSISNIRWKFFPSQR